MRRHVFSSQLDTSTRFVVVGLGSIGKRHLANLRSLMPDAQITVWRQHGQETSLADLPDERVNVVYSLADALAAKPHAALICNPAPFHVATAKPLVDGGAHIFMEKPLSDDMAGVDQLLDAYAERGRVFFVAYPLRFDPALQAMRAAINAGEIGKPLSLSAEVGQYLPDWRPQQDYRKGVSARKDLGGGALLELSHELDYVRWLMGDVASVSSRLTKQSNLEIDVED
ncbi:MAG: Gfo/Idh/MocA family oxidoreductase, partial [Pirellulaceae bacterium]|nr:Gfo/Idh/MocA family oxidoreductase [Pirellulaceae bacterium]